METRIPLERGLSLRISDTPTPESPYATGRLARGLLLELGDRELAEEAVGFGVPVVKKGLITIFPGQVSLDVRQHGAVTAIRALFTLNLVERFSQPRGSNLQNSRFYELKNLLSAAMRHVPSSRVPLTSVSSFLRRVFHWETIYADSGFATAVAVSFTATAHDGVIGFEIDASSLDPEITELVLMHEHGARAFDTYRDASGIREQGDRIGLWDEVRGSEAWFESSAHHVAFRVRRLEGARLFRGRELIEGRLAWAGFGYSFRPPVRLSRHEVLISRLT
jgi:hypothetical protein